MGQMFDYYFENTGINELISEDVRLEREHHACTVWTAKGGRKIPFRELESDHLDNIIVAILSKKILQPRVVLVALWEERERRVAMRKAEK